MDPAEREELEAWFLGYFRMAVTMNGLLEVEEVGPVIRKANRCAVLVQEGSLGMGIPPAPRQLPRMVRLRPARRFVWYMRVYVSLLGKLALTPGSHAREQAARASDGRGFPRN
jgi:hypothetical protein